MRGGRLILDGTYQHRAGGRYEQRKARSSAGGAIRQSALGVTRALRFGPPGLMI